MKTVTKANSGFQHFYWLIDLLAFGIVFLLAYLLWLAIPLIHDKINDHFTPVIPKTVVRVDLMDRFCPEEKTQLKQMYYYNRTLGKKTKLFVGSKETIAEALLTLEEGEPVITHYCYYYN